MARAQETTATVVSRILRLEELTHELSNTLGSSTNQISIAILRDSRGVSPEVLVAARNALRVNETLRALMLELYELHRQIIGRV